MQANLTLVKVCSNNSLMEAEPNGEARYNCGMPNGQI